MEKIARLRASQREELFQEVSALRAMYPAVFEKDFWVCFVLSELFSDAYLKDREFDKIIGTLTALEAEANSGS